MKIDKISIAFALTKYRSAAREEARNAALGGRMDDGGCHRMLEVVQAFEDGMNQEVPEFLKGYVKEAQNQADPEYQEFLRLRKKFDNQ
jgi:hypothetical protein